MDRTPDNDRSNPLSRAFSKFLERGRVGDRDRGAGARPAQQPTSPARPVTGTGGAGGLGATTQVPATSPTSAAGVPQAAAPSAVQAAAPTPTTSRRTHTVVKGDSLSKIAQQVYGRADRWTLIFEANRDKIQDPDKIYPGQVLVIPDAQQVH